MTTGPDRRLTLRPDEDLDAAQVLESATAPSEPDNQPKYCTGEFQPYDEGRLNGRDAVDMMWEQYRFPRTITPAAGDIIVRDTLANCRGRNRYASLGVPDAELYPASFLKTLLQLAPKDSREYIEDLLRADERWPHTTWTGYRVLVTWQPEMPEPQVTLELVCNLSRTRSHSAPHVGNRVERPLRPWTPPRIPRPQPHPAPSVSNPSTTATRPRGLIGTLGDMISGLFH